MGLDGIPVPPAFRAHWVVPLCISLSHDLPKHPAPSPVYFPTQSPGGKVFGLFHMSGLSMRHLPSSEKDQEFDILNPKQLLPGLLQICGSAACNEVHGERKAIFNLGLVSSGGNICCPPRNSGPLSMPCRVLRAQEIIKINCLQQMGKQRRGWGEGGGGAKAWSRACSKLASWGMVLPQAS